MAEQKKYYKVLDANGHSFNGGDLQWSLPIKRGKGWQPGKWHKIDGSIRVCNNGLHLTTEPYNWYQWNCRIFEAQGDGDSESLEDKTAFRRARLLKPVPEPEWLLKAKRIIGSIQQIKWLKPQLPAKPEWKVFPNRNAALIATGDAAWNAALNAALNASLIAEGNAAWNAALNAALSAALNAARSAAGNAARSAAGNAARSAAGNAALSVALSAAGSAALITRIEGICSDLNIDEHHRIHARARWEVWQLGYGLLCDIDGVLYVYEKP